MSELSFYCSIPGINRPGPLGFQKTWFQEYAITRNEHGRLIVVPVISARAILSEQEIRNDPAGANKFVRMGPDLTLDLEARNNVGNIITFADFLEYNQIYIYAGELAEYRIKDRDTYELKPHPVASLSNETRHYIIEYDNKPYRSVDDLKDINDNPERLEFCPIDKSYWVGNLANVWIDIDRQLANNYRPKSKDRPVIINPPMISANLRKDAIKGIISTYPERVINGQDVLREQYPPWSSLTEAQKQRNPWRELANLLRPMNVYEGITDKEYNEAVQSCIKATMVGGASRLIKPTKIDTFPILIGEEQGTGKSSFLDYLGADITNLDTFKGSFDRSPYKGEIDRYKSDESGDRHANNKTWESSRGKIITEFVEGNALRRATVNTFKILADQTTAIYSRLYEDQHEERITTTFWITTNDTNPLVDSENRRFFPIQINATQTNPLPIAHAIRDKQTDPDYNEIMEEFRELLLVARAHAYKLASEGHPPQEYLTDEFRRVQRTANGQTVSVDPLDVRIEEILTREAPLIFDEIGEVINGVRYANYTEVKKKLLQRCYDSLSPIETKGEGFARSFKTVWNGRRDKCGLARTSSQGQVMTIGGKSRRVIWEVTPEGAPKPYRGI